MVLEEFERRYLELFWKRQRYQWDNYVLGSGHDLCVVDGEMFELATSYRDQRHPSGRQTDILHAIVSRELVDKHPDVRRLRNRLDDWNNYAHGLTEAEAEDPLYYRLGLARRMKPDVLELIRTRNLLAQRSGFPSYVELVLSTEDIQFEPLITFLDSYVEENMPNVHRLIRTHTPSLSLPTWFSHLATIGRIEGGLNHDQIAAELLRRMGFGELANRIHVTSNEQGLPGYVGVLSVPDDIRVLVRPPDSLARWLTLFHELGHAVAHASNTTAGVFRTWTGVHDESMAAVMERIAAKVMLDGGNLRSARGVFALETARCAISALFEFALWEHPKAAESLYAEYYGRLGVDIGSPEIWPLDSFRSIDPVYVHNYVIADRVAERTIEFLDKKYGDDIERWGEWLTGNYYADGRSRSLFEKTKSIGFSSEWIT